ncbi:GL26062 [Drosophila persimilis]|uniref:GL26062 n=1 Tax=Drosophila persimilis TaxID=7234 RepID=B4GUJ2_DROPE|nr:GL26062 [Drosophila persimilis]
MSSEIENQVNRRIYLTQRMLDAVTTTSRSLVVDPEDLQPLQPMALEDGQEEPQGQGEPKGQEKPQDQEEKIK